MPRVRGCQHTPTSYAGFLEVMSFFIKWSCSDVVCELCWERVFLDAVETCWLCALCLLRRVYMELL